MHDDLEKRRLLGEIERRMDDMDDPELQEVLALLRLMLGEAPEAPPEVLLSLHRNLIRASRRNVLDIADFMPRLTAMVQQILDAVPSVRERYILRSYYLLADDINKHRIEDALNKSGVQKKPA